MLRDHAAMIADFMTSCATSIPTPTPPKLGWRAEERLADFSLEWARGLVVDSRAHVRAGPLSAESFAVGVRMVVFSRPGHPWINIHLGRFASRGFRYGASTGTSRRMSDFRQRARRRVRTLRRASP